MSYDRYERSASGAPVELYQWRHGGDTYRYTSAQQVQQHLGQSYAPAPIHRGAISQGDAIERAALAVTLPQDHPVATLFRASTPAERVLLTMWRRHISDPDAETIVLWAGRVRSCTWEQAQATLGHEPIWTALRRVGLRRTWGRQCPHVLGDGECRVDLTPLLVAGTVARVMGLNVEVAAAGTKPNGYFAGGVLTVTVAGVTWRVMIMRHSGPTLGLHLRIPGLGPGAAVSLSPGCDHTFDGAGGCRQRFGNGLNYGGFPYTPRLSPHGGTRLY